MKLLQRIYDLISGIIAIYRCSIIFYSSGCMNFDNVLILSLCVINVCWSFVIKSISLATAYIFINPCSIPSKNSNYDQIIWTFWHPPWLIQLNLFSHCESGSWKIWHLIIYKIRTAKNCRIKMKPSFLHHFMTSFDDNRHCSFVENDLCFSLTIRLAMAFSQTTNFNQLLINVTRHMLC
mgnify:CR=1 FL=1